MSSPVGETLLTVCRDARSNLLLVAPYIKFDALVKVLDATSPGVSVQVITRWRLDELASGVSDLAIWPALCARGHAELWLQPSLHAKYYRADNRSILGSANLTGAGLGWSASSNLELLVESSHLAEHLSLFESEAFRGAKKVDDAIYLAFKAALDTLLPLPPPQLEGVQIDNVKFATWRPSLRFPQDMWRYYSGDRNNLTTASCDAARLDLAALDPPAALSQDVFHSWIALQLRQHPEVQAIEAFGVQSRRFGEMTSLLTSLGAQDGAHAWQTWMRWLGHFDPTRFKFHVANYSEIFEVVAPTQ
ncbi:hypothetical protein EN784_01295 [bacterium M00.F.Ca.ET.141.01.1.1]|nr:hypothetical protein EN784_01295 [bacterium M00.F.Ca.ET.141.01.1.1]